MFASRYFGPQSHVFMIFTVAIKKTLRSILLMYFTGIFINCNTSCVATETIGLHQATGGEFLLLDRGVACFFSNVGTCIATNAEGVSF